MAAEGYEAARGESGAGGWWRGERVGRVFGSMGAEQAWRRFAASTEGSGGEGRRAWRHDAMVVKRKEGRFWGM